MPLNAGWFNGWEKAANLLIEESKMKNSTSLSIQEPTESGHKIGDYKKIPEGRILAIPLSATDALMSGVFKIGVMNTGEVILKYTDGTSEKAILSENEIKLAQHAFNLISGVQSKRKGA